ncbi:MAG: translation initiation factor IF-1 [Candidatus Phytoplasma stylosanthis]|uniref:translation initiation factor IF-1 n=1 Tax=Candidatus Phytoplasma stylosanthis TaxID=2798314 RepID=UPI00293B6E0E|nr:translation initiation factor IF-1 [Candidatus Phytoplasma stylosanthis]MDV3167860.1 translation initiation factor IF-1 [Candidatus Phytoplasma stylosanthis]MDV3170864.1 translation initiation factor IF-1 [Candidatus Phytoplasma stylosanthis]MDV3173510.1 translation initiation factor IF-1 [Candidatus Phytoplasma stylosanthis]MDV3174044.1 translation initiation factor IF-1 [Candidatus Phytoplasma stylosanthis]MDV3196403.1 translation initiation factor IF-1 [Candidatus Phytoplasma stylosanthi
MINNENTVDAIVVGVLPNAKFKLKLPDDRIIISYISGKIRVNKIGILLGDKVKVDNKGRIVFRYIDKNSK